MPPKWSFSLRHLLLLVAVAAGSLGVHKWFWQADESNYQIFLGIYLALFSVATVGAFSTRPPLANALLVFVVFGLAYFFVVLHAGFGITNAWEAVLLTRHIQLGIALSVLSAIGGYLAFSMFQRPAN